MMSQLCGELRSVTILAANEAGLVNAVANPSAAFGAISCTICSMAVPSSPEPACPATTSTVGSWPAPCSTASELTPSESTQILTPVPSIPVATARSAPWA